MIASITTCKNEADIIETFVKHTLSQVDRMLVSDNASTDGTREKLDELETANERLAVLDDPELAWYQSDKMSRLARQVGDMGADWVIPADVDELWFARDGRLGDVLSGLKGEILFAQAELYDHVAVTGNGNNPISEMVWRNFEPLPLRKVCARYRDGLVFAPGNHSAGYPDIKVPPAALDLLVVHHFPYRSPEQFVTKALDGARGYAAAEVPDNLGVHKREWGRIYDEHGEKALHDLFYERFHSGKPTQDKRLVADPCPL